MILYNITVIIDSSIEALWLKWINQTFLTQASESDLLISNRLLKVLDSPNEGLTYCLQFVAESLQNYTEFKDKYATALLEAHAVEFKNQSVFFSSTMEFIN